MKITTLILIGGAILSSCGEIKEPASPTATIANSQNDSDDKGTTDYKAMFGPGYKKGDIGHSTGVVSEGKLAAGVVMIEHGKIHGIERGAGTTRFETLGGVDLSTISSGIKVEFLVKKGTDSIYRLFAICEVLQDGKSCL